jgi:hypothetical protein
MDLSGPGIDVKLKERKKERKVKGYLQTSSKGFTLVGERGAR